MNILKTTHEIRSTATGLNNLACNDLLTFSRDVEEKLKIIDDLIIELHCAMIEEAQESGVELHRKYACVSG